MGHIEQGQGSSIQMPPLSFLSVEIGPWSLPAMIAKSLQNLPQPLPTWANVAGLFTWPYMGTPGKVSAYGDLQVCLHWCVTVLLTSLGERPVRILICSRV